MRRECKVLLQWGMPVVWVLLFGVLSSVCSGRICNPGVANPAIEPLSDGGPAANPFRPLGPDGGADSPWQFVVVGDSRGDENGVNVPVWRHLVAAILAERPDFVLFPGDLTTDGERSEFETWVRTAHPLYANGIGVYPVRGNHDADDPEDWNMVFRGAYGLPQNGPTGEKNLTYSVTHKNAFIAALDNYFGESKVNQPWLDVQLAANDAPHVFVFGHEAAFAGYHSSCLDDHSEQRDVFWQRIAEAGGRVYFCGHDHYYDRARIDDGDGDPTDDIHQIVVGTGGAPFYEFDGRYEGDNGTFTPIQQYHAENFGYMVVRIDGPRVNLTFKEWKSARYVPTDSMHYSIAERTAP